MGFGDFLSEAVSAGASALGVDTDDIGGLFEQAKGALGGDTDDLFGAAAQQLGIDSDDLTSAVGAFGGGGGATDAVDQISQLFGGGDDAASGTGGGFAGIVSGFLGEDGGDVGGVAQQALGSFGALLSGAGAGDGGGGGVAAFLPDSVRQAFSEAADLPIVQDAAGGDWAAIASSVPGLDGALGSFGLSTKGVAEHIEAVGTQAVDGGSAWSIGSMLADHGTQFLSAVAAPVNADSVWSSLPGVAQSAGVELPGWASGIASAGLLSREGRTLPEGGFVPAEGTGDPWGMSQNAPAEAVPSAAHLGQREDPALSAASDTDDMSDDATGESQVAAQTDDSLDAFDTQPASAGESDGLDQYSGDDLDPATIQPVESPESPTFDEPAPAPDQFAAADELEDSLGDLGDDIG